MRPHSRVTERRGERSLQNEASRSRLSGRMAGRDGSTPQRRALLDKFAVVPARENVGMNDFKFAPYASCGPNGVGRPRDAGLLTERYPLPSNSAALGHGWAGCAGPTVESAGGGSLDFAVSAVAELAAGVAASGSC
jgi:hypothetical protein